MVGLCGLMVVFVVLVVVFCFVGVVVLLLCLCFGVVGFFVGMKFGFFGKCGVIFNFFVVFD